MSNQLTVLMDKLAQELGMAQGEGLKETLKATAFKGQQVTDDQMTALMAVANQHKLNPWTNEIYAFPSKGAIIPVVGVDGWASIINRHPQFDGMDFEQDDESCTCTIYRKDRQHPIRTTEYMSECKRDTQPWKSHPKRMLRHKALIQGARLAFGYTGFYDPDEAERIREVDMGKADVVPPQITLSQERIEQLFANIESCTTVDELKEVWVSGNEEMLKAKFNSSEFKAAVNAKKLSLNTVEG